MKPDNRSCFEVKASEAFYKAEAHNLGAESAELQEQLATVLGASNRKTSCINRMRHEVAGMRRHQGKVEAERDALRIELLHVKQELEARRKALAFNAGWNKFEGGMEIAAKR